MAESAQTEKNTEKTYQIYKNAQSVLGSANTIEENLPGEESTDSAKLRAQINATMYAIETYVKVIRICEIRSRAKAIDDSASENAAKSFETIEMSKKIKESAEKEAKKYSGVAAYAAADKRADAIESARHNLRLAKIGYENSKETKRLAETIHSEFEFVNTATEKAFIQLQAAKTAAQNTSSAKYVAQAQKYTQDAFFAKDRTNRLMSDAIKHHEQMEELQENSYSIPYDSSSLSQDELEMNLMINETLKKLLRLKAAVDTEVYEVQFNFENAYQSENAPQAEEALTQAKKAFAKIETYEKQSEELAREANHISTYAKLRHFLNTDLIQRAVDKISAISKEIKDAVEVSKSGLRSIELILASKNGSK